MPVARNQPTEAEILFAALGSRDEERRYQALQKALALSEEPLRDLVAVAKRRDPQFLWRCWLIGGLAGGTVLGGLFVPSLPCLVTGLLGGVCWAASEWRRPLRYEQDENLLRVLRGAPAGCCVEAVLWMLETPQGERCERLLAILKERLPDLQPEDAQEWTRKQKEVLLLILRAWHRHPDLACVLLQAMPKIGGKWALDTAERLARLKHWDPASLRTTYQKVRQDSLPWSEGVRNGRKPTEREVEEMLAVFGRIGEAATECLPGLWARIQDEADAHILLRPSAPTDTPTELLRPASDQGQEIASTNLLRAGNAPTRSPDEKV